MEFLHNPVNPSTLIIWYSYFLLLCFFCCCTLIKLNSPYILLPPFRLLGVCCHEIQTYGTGLVMVSLKATLGFPITQAQLYSLSILWNNKPKQTFIWGTNLLLLTHRPPDVRRSCLEIAENSEQIIDMLLLHLVLKHIPDLQSDWVPGSRFPDAVRPCPRWLFLYSPCQNALGTLGLLWWNGWYLWRICPGHSVHIQDDKEGKELKI